MNRSLVPLRSCRRTVALAVACSLACTGLATTASSAVISTVVYEEGFEVDVGNWVPFGTNPEITRVASGTGGIPSAAGDWHAEVGGAYTFFSGTNTPGSKYGFITTIDIYLDVNGGWDNDTRVDYSVAASRVTGDHLRDFIYAIGFYDDLAVSGVGTGAGFAVSASNNAPGNPVDSNRAPVALTETGWYTFQHLFQEGADGALEVTMSVHNDQGSELGSWVLSNTNDDFDTVFGGSRYGWFLNNGFGVLAIDNVMMTVAPEPGKTVLLAVAMLGLLAGRRRRPRTLST